MSADTIHLPLNFHWYDETTKAVDPKRVEYRSMQTVTKDTCQLIPSKHMRDIWEKRDAIKFVRFSRGYTKTTALFAVTLIDIGPCPIPAWNGDYIRIHFTDLPSNTPGDDAVFS